jgi:type VI secretion system protein ImpL
VGLTDFARVFGPNGELDRYFAQNLAKYADKSKRDWTWKSADPVGHALSPGTIRSFQQASQIRDAFFAGGAAQPSFQITVTPPVVNDPQVTAQMDFYGAPIVSKLGTNAPTIASWPGGGSFQLKITVTATPAPAPVLDPTAPKLDNTSQPAQPDVSILASKNGVWALFRLLDDAARGGTKVTFFSGGQDYAYQFSPTSAANPLNLNALRQFHCPANI